jgi:phospholipid/cholesterol/gamma-HCH transport system substrate-binding protein
MTKEAKIGILTTLTIAILYFGSSYLKGKSIFNTDNVYYVLYDLNDGIKESSPITFKGMVVGKVISIEILPDKDYKIKVGFTVSKKIKLTSNTEARMVTTVLGLGVGSINLVINTGDPLPAKSFLQGTLDKGIAEGLIKNIPAFKSIDDVLSITNKFLLEVAKNTDKISAIFINLEVITQKLITLIARNESNITNISYQISRAMTMITDESNGLKPVLISISTIAKALNGEVTRNYIEKLSSVISNLDIILAKAASGGNSIGKLLADSQLYDNLNNTVLNADKLVIDLKEHPSRYVSFSIFGGANKAPKK